MFKKSKFRLKSRCLKFCSSVGLVTLLFSGTALAQKMPEPPVNSGIAFRLLPMPESASSVDRAALLGHPLFQMIGRAGKEVFHFDPLTFVKDTFEGTLVVAILSKSDSSLSTYLRDNEARTSWSSAVNELNSLATDLRDTYGSEEQYPQDLTSYIAEVRYYDVSLPDGVSYSYKTVEGGRGFRISMIVDKNSRLASLGKPPVFTQAEPLGSLQPTTTPKPLNLVVGTKLKDSSQLIEFFDQNFGPRQNGFWDLSEPGSMPFHVTIRGNWLVGSDQKANLGGFLKSLNSEQAGWSANPAFQKVTRNIDGKAPLLFFADTQSLIKAFEPQSDGPEAQLLSLAGPMGYAVVPYTDSQMRIEAFIGVDSPKGSKLEKFFASGRGQSPKAELITPNIPWDSSNVFALEYGNSKELLDSTLTLFPEIQSQFDMGQDVFAGLLGLDAEAGFNKLLEGPAIVSFERIDIFLNAMDGYLSVKNVTSESYDIGDDVGGPSGDVEPEISSMEAQGGGQIEDLVPPPGAEPALPEDSPAAEETSSSSEDFVTRVPATFAFKVPIVSNRERIVSHLETYMGDDIVTDSVEGVEIKTGAEGRLSYALDDQWVYVSSGRTDRLMRSMLAASKGKKDTLSSLDTWSRFSGKNEGKLLAFGHQKVDWAYSMVKGFLLLLGAEFRPLATELGNLRDYHSVVTAVPDGFMMVGEIVQGDGR